MKTFLLIIATVVLAMSPVHAAEPTSTLEQIQKSGKIRIGFRESHPPMSFLDKNGQPAGYSIDLCMRIYNEVKTTLGDPEITVEYVPLTSTNRFEAVAKNEVDILCGATTKTIERGKLVDFTQLTFVTGASLLSLKDSAVDGTSGLQGKKIGVSRGTTTIDALQSSLKESVIDAQIVPFDNTAEGLKALLAGEIDAVSADQIVLIGLVLTHSGDDEFVIAKDIFSYEPFALAIRRNDSEFRLLADSVLAQLYRSGKISPIYSKWFGQFTKEVPTLLQAMYVLNSTPE